MPTGGVLCRSRTDQLERSQEGTKQKAEEVADLERKT
jgi:hypothetical protein